MPECKFFIIPRPTHSIGQRAFSQQHAQRLGIKSYAQTRADDDIEILACGEVTALLALEHWLWQRSAPADPSSSQTHKTRFSTLAAFETV